MKISIRSAQANDLREIVAIHNQAIRKRSCTGYLKEFTVKERAAWLQSHQKNTYPLFVALSQSKVVGWISISPYRIGRDAFKKTGELDCFIHEDFQRKGIGTDLLHHMLLQAKALGFTRLLAIVLDQNIVSRTLLEKNGFEEWGFLPAIGEIDGNIFSHIYLGKKL